MANIKQVAALAGLSVSCVSKYLKNPGSVLPDSRQRIEAAIEELQYTPSAMARYLRTKRTYTVKAGDSFWKIAERELGNGMKMYDLARANKMTIQSVIHPGQILKLP